jgi:hypothetical protein
MEKMLLQIFQFGYDVEMIEFKNENDETFYEVYARRKEKTGTSLWQQNYSRHSINETGEALKIAVKKVVNEIIKKEKVLAFNQDELREYLRANG